jgi:hypothetical protein
MMRKGSNFNGRLIHPIEISRSTLFQWLYLQETSTVNYDYDFLDFPANIGDKQQATAESEDAPDFQCCHR